MVKIPNVGRVGLALLQKISRQGLGLKIFIGKGLLLLLFVIFSESDETDTKFCNGSITVSCKQLGQLTSYILNYLIIEKIQRL